MTTSRFFKGTIRYLMGFETCSRLLFYIAVIATVVNSFLSHQWIVLGIVFLLWLLRFLIQITVFRNASKDLGERKFYALLPVFDFLQPMWNLGFKLQRRIRRKDEFMRR